VAGASARSSVNVAAAGRERQGEQHHVDTTAREASVRLVRRRRGDGEAIGRRAVQEVPHPQRCLVAVAHHQHSELGVVPGLRLPPAGGLASIHRLAPFGLIASFLLERNELQAALAGATFQVGAARR